MNRHKDTQFHKEKRKILLVYLAFLILSLILAAIVAVYANPPLSFYITVLSYLGILTLFFLIAYKMPARFGWLFGGRRRRFSGTPWQSRVGRELTHMDARMAAEEEAEYEEARYHEKPEDLKDMRQVREKIKDRRNIDLPKQSEKESQIAADVLKCPQCDVPYVFDKDNPICKRCGTKLHDGTQPV